MPGNIDVGNTPHVLHVNLMLKMLLNNVVLLELPEEGLFESFTCISFQSGLTLLMSINRNSPFLTFFVINNSLHLAP